MLDLVIEGRRRDLGGGLEVGRVLPFARRRMVGPFIFLDHMGPADFRAGEGIDVRPHPHIGLSTVTYLFDGEIHHHDNLGVSQKIRPGEVNWMTAGSGIMHSERTDPSLRSSGGLMHGMQAWVALPQEDEETAPAFAHHDAGELPELSDGGIWARLIAGSAYGLSNGVRPSRRCSICTAELAAGARMAMPAEHAERAAYVVSGRWRIDGARYPAGRMLVFANGGEPVIARRGRAGARDAARRRERSGRASSGGTWCRRGANGSNRRRPTGSPAGWRCRRTTTASSSAAGGTAARRDRSS